MIQTKNLRCYLITSHLARLYRYGLQLRICLGQHFHIVRCTHHGITLQTQHGAQHVESLRFGHRLFRYKIDGAFDARINDEGITRVMTDGAHHGFDISANEIQRGLIRGRVLCSGR